MAREGRLAIFPAFIREVSISARVDAVERLPDSLATAFGVPLEGS